jgi:hypothetical protein
VVLRRCEGTHRDAPVKQQPGDPAARRPRGRSLGQARSQEHSSASPAV